MISDPFEHEFVEVVVPDGDRVRVEFHGEIARHPEIQAGVVQLLAEAKDGDVYQAIAAYAQMFGLAVTYFLGQQVLIVELYVPLVP